MEKSKIIILVVLLLSGCVEQIPVEEKTIQSNDTIKIASFNIQTYGQSKSSNQEVLEILTIVACEFDIMAIQEIRDASGDSLLIYLENINAVCENGERDYIMSEPLGRSVSKERYAFIYNKETVKNLGYIVYDDSGDWFEREPYLAKFQSGNLTFTAINMHIKPTDATNEMTALQEVMVNVNDKNKIILGDLNADCSYFDEDSSILRYYEWIVSNNADTTISSTNCAYDRIIVSADMYNKYTGEWNTFRFDEILGLTSEQAKDVSDHYPVWAEFYTS